jgi:hypothetical protein
MSISGWFREAHPMTFPPTLTEIIAAIKARDLAAGPKHILRWDTALAARVEALEAAIDKAMGDLTWDDVQAAQRRLKAVGGQG